MRKRVRFDRSGKVAYLYCMNGWNQYALAVSKLLGISHGQVVIVAVLLLFALFLGLRRNFWGTFKFLLIIGIFGVIAYYAYDFTMISLKKKEALTNKRGVIDDGRP